MIARDMEIGAGRRRGGKREQQQGERRDAHGSVRNRIEPVGTRESRVPKLDQTRQLWPYCVGI
jgi:hypothetical protein